jgi:hypothetical protein
MSNDKIRYDVLSPDGISIHPIDTYSSDRKAKVAFEKWKERYKIQGYYSSTKYGRIPLDELFDYCKIIQVLTSD